MRKIIISLFNNIPVNNFLIAIKKDHFIKKWIYNWNTWKFDNSKSLQANVGCSAHPLIQELVDISHRHLKTTVAQNLVKGANILDLGCGPGLFLADFDTSYHLFGIDMNTSFLNKAKGIVPSAAFFHGNFLDITFPVKFDLIFSFSVFQYIEVSNLDLFFKKITKDLNPGGFFYMQYPHAVEVKDLFYPDLSYIKYSPRLVEKIAGKYLKIIRHQHYFDNRKADKYDKDHYHHPNDDNRTDTIQNMYLLIAQKH